MKMLVQIYNAKEEKLFINFNRVSATSDLISKQISQMKKLVNELPIMGWLLWRILPLQAREESGSSSVDRVARLRMFEKLENITHGRRSPKGWKYLGSRF